MADGSVDKTEGSGSTVMVGRRAELSLGKRMPTVTTSDGVEIFYKDWGSGQPVVFSHGWPLTADVWDSSANVVASHGSDMRPVAARSRDMSVATARLGWPRWCCSARSRHSCSGPKPILKACRSSRSIRFGTASFLTCL